MLFEIQPLNLMRRRISNFFLGTFRKSDLSTLRERFLSLSSRLKIKTAFSLKSLIFIGFITAVIPLFFAVLYAVLSMHENSVLGETINSRVFEQTKAVRSVLQKTADIERKARLFVLLSDPLVRQPYEQQSYESMRASFKQALEKLLKLRLDNKITLLVNELSEKENLIYQQIIDLTTEKTLKFPVDEAFRGLRQSSHNLSSEFEHQVDEEFNKLRQQSKALEHGLLFKSGFMLLISVIFFLILLTLLTRSLRQLESSIRRLGSGELDEPIEVSGPSDLRFLGNRLEWLRTHLINLENSKQHFIHNVAREIDSPLENIRNSVEQLASAPDIDQSNVKKGIAHSICNDIDKLKIISEELLRFSQINSSNENNPKATVNMKRLLESVIDDFQTRLQDKAINIKLLARPVEISGYQSQLQSILEELISNAVKYSPEGGEIRIMLLDSGSQMELEVEDEGPGIEPSDRQHVFEPFYRSKTSSDQNSIEGPGLGLSIVREYVANHQGKIEIIDSREDQHGARILVQIPLSQKI